MKNKMEILAALARTPADRLILAGLLDKERACRERGYLTTTRFLNEAERGLCMQAVSLLNAQDHIVFWGGFAEAERTICLCYPDYLDAEAAQTQAPLALLRIHKRRGDSLSHRDYLGALLGLQIERAMVGDILVHDEGADVFVLEEIAAFLLCHFRQVKRATVTVTREALGSERHAPLIQQTGRGAVASPRLDSVLAVLFGLSRSKAQAAIEKGLVFVNHIPCTKADRILNAGDKLTARGIGRAELLAFTGTSKKGRLFLEYVRTKA